jgi:hypothetical protein
VADEIAHLRLTLGVKVALMQDDLFILPGEKKAVARMAALKDALDARDVRDMVFWIKGRPESMWGIAVIVGGELISLSSFAFYLSLQDVHASLKTVNVTHSHLLAFYI